MNNRLAIILFGVYLIFSLIYLISQHGQSSGTRNSGRRHPQAVEDTLDVQLDKQSFRHPDELAKFVIQDDKQEKSEQGRHRKVKGDRPESSNVGIKPVDEEREESYADTDSKSKTSVPKISPQPVSPNSTKRLPKKTSNRTPVGSNVSKKDRPQRFRTSSSGPAVKLAFLLLAHDDPSIKGLEDLLSTLYTKDHVYFIHVDAKLNSPAYFSFYAEWVFKENVVFSSTRFNIKWGSFDIVKAELDLLKLAVEYNHMVAASNNVTNTTVQSQTNDAEVKTSVSGHPVESNVKRSANRKWDFAINLCGSTVAVKSLEKIQDHFAGLDVGANVVFADDVVQVCDWSDTTGKAKDPCDKILARCADPECSKMDKTPNGLLVFKGPQWVILSSEFSAHIFTRPDLQSWIKFFTHSFAADEMFFPTLLMNSPLNDTYQIGDPNEGVGHGYPSNYKFGNVFHIFTFWGPCQSYKPPRKQGWSPCWIGDKELDMIVKSDKLFVRKVRGDDVEMRKKLKGLFIG